jgi:polysaccharide deacetylase 2 family uncharacterized protein YibQ
MAAQSKKTNTRSTTSKKTPTKRRRKKNSTFKKSLFIVLGVFLMISMVVFGYYLGQNDMLNGHTSIAQTYKTHESEGKKKILEDLSKIKTQKPQEKEIKKELKRYPKPLADEKRIQNEMIIQEALSEVEEDNNRVVLAHKGGKPKLAIILDDVSQQSQLKKIQATGLKLTPAIFPPSQRSKTSHKLAKGLEHYMIHLPMESGSAQFNKQAKTLITTFTKEQIEDRVKEIRALFPTARFVNNHTGSVYTDDYHAMKTLYRTLRSEGFIFVDSRTIGSTKVPQIADEFGDAYVARDVFLDNEHNVPYIHKQLQKAVNKAKQRGYAIAIGHPHKMTLKALSTAQHIFADVELVYMDELYR